MPVLNAIFAWCARLTLALALLPAVATTYYVDSSGGSDSNNGTATNSAWQTLAKINGTTFSPGDVLLLKNGGSWTNTMNPKGSGTSGNPIILSAYGTNAARPLINGNGNADALVLTNQQYWEINNLEVINPGLGTTNERRGLHLCAANFGTVNHLYVSNCLVHGICGRVDGTNQAGDNGDLVAKRTGGIVVEVIDDSSLPTRFNDIRILNCTIMSVTNQGLVACANRTSPSDYPGTFNWNNEHCSNLLVSGNSISVVCKNAMSIRYADESCLIESNLVHDTANTTDGNQICCYSSRGTVFQYNEGYHNNGDGAADGSLYDADLRSPQTVWQCSYSHDNSWGLFVQYASADTNGNDTGIVVRYNLSQNDRGDIFAFAGEVGGIAAARLFNNTIYATNLSATFFADQFNGTHSNGVYNNIFYSSTGATNLYTFHSYNTYAFSNNLFYGAHPADEPSDAGKLTNNPLLVAPGTGGGVGGTNNFSTLFGYKLQSGSPCINSGLTITTNLVGNTNAGGLDFFGVTVPYGAGNDRGASEWIPAGAPPRLQVFGVTSGRNLQVDFTNTPGASFTVTATTNLSLARSNWTTLGTAAEVAPGQFQFVDALTNRPARFYQVHSP